MRFMIIVKATAETEKEVAGTIPDQELMAAMAAFHEEMGRRQASVAVTRLFT